MERSQPSIVNLTELSPMRESAELEAINERAGPMSVFTETYWTIAAVAAG